MTPKYERAGIEGALVERFLAGVAERAAACRPASVLDAGCGEGQVTARVAAALPRAWVCGIDRDERALAAARRRLPGAALAVADVYALPFPDGAFDLVVCTEVLEHLADPAPALAELRRVAARAVLVTVPHEPWFRLGNLARRRHLRRLGATPGHRWTWTRRGFARVVGEDASRFGLFPWQGAVLASPRAAAPSAAPTAAPAPARAPASAPLA